MRINPHTRLRCSPRLWVMPGQLPSADDPHARHASTPAELLRLNAAERRSHPLLTWRNQDGDLEIVELEPGERYSIGRSSDTSIVLAWDRKISGLHATLECIGGHWVVSDAGLSKNGTRVNGGRIEQDTRLQDRDLIRVGDSMLSFRQGGVQAPPTLTLTEDNPDDVPVFDARDREILVELCRLYVEHGLPKAVETTEIAPRLNLSPSAIKQRLRQMYRRSGVGEPKREELMKLVVRHGVVSQRDYRRSGDPS
jgi:pSer/pThr/pTyr-binding forkhead associated (FHA) protein